MSALFDRAAQWTAKQSGHAHTFALAIIVVIVWAVSGPLFGFSDTWQLVINTGTTIVTFLMVFLIQNTQNRDTEALQLKLDELIRVTEQARNRLINLEDLTEEEMDRVKKELTEVARTDRSAEGDGDGVVDPQRRPMDRPTSPTGVLGRPPPVAESIRRGSSAERFYENRWTHRFS